MHANNPIVIELAQKIDRTPSAVALKLVNFASMDPELQKRGVRGMSNASKTDRAVWDEFHGRWEKLASAYSFLYSDDPGTPVKQGFAIQQRTQPEATEITRSVRFRVGQRFFRNSVLAAFDTRCCITNISSIELLRASHIMPWACSKENRLNPRNGLCLNALHDAAFDRGLITVGDEFQLVLSNRLKNEMPSDLFETAFGRHAGHRIRLPERFVPDTELLEYHQTKVFVG